MNKKDVLNQVLNMLSLRLKKLGLDTNSVDHSNSLLDQGILDSMGFIEFIADLEVSFEIEFDFEDLDASDFTSIQQLTDLVMSKQHTT